MMSLTSGYVTRGLAVLALFLGLSLFVFSNIAQASEIETPIDTLATNHAPVALPDAYTTGVDEVLTTTVISGVLSNDTDDDFDEGDTLTATLVTDVSHGTLALNADGSFTYTPEAGYDGSDSFTYSASDGEQSATAQVDIIISTNEDAPFTQNDEYATDEDTTLTVDAASGVLANDNDPNDLPLVAVLESDVNDGTLAFAADGSFVYTPDHDWNGLETFTYRACNGTVSEGDCSGLFGSTRTVEITVRPIEDGIIGGENGEATSTASTTPSSSGDTTTSSGSGSSGHHGGSHSSSGQSGGNGSKGGQVLGTSTSATCGVPYLNSYLRIGRDNNPAEMMKLQTFLNTEMKLNLAVSGIFDTATYEAVQAFQVKYWEGVLKPWVPFGLESDHTPTGYVYKTTQWQINTIMCSSSTYPAPVLP